MNSAPLSRSAHALPHQQDFDLHGVVGIRVLDGTPEDIAKVRRQLGPLEATLAREPDITIRFVDSVTDRPLTLVGVGESGFNQDGFFLLQGKGGAPGRAALPFQDVGTKPVIVCERRMPAVPHLLAVINLAALTKGVLPLHATAFTIGSNGVLVTGWSKGGKTEALLACMEEGARYVGDEWVYLTPDGQMFGLPEPIRLWSWQFAQMPALLQARTSRERRRLALWKRLARAAESAARSRLPGSGLVRRGAPALGRQAYLQVPPADLFGADSVISQARLDVVVLVLSHEPSETAVQPLEPGEIARRMEASLAEERAAFMTHYRHFLYAFPDRQNAILDNVAELESKLLATLLGTCPSTKVAHPHPCDIRLLGSTVRHAAEATLAERHQASGDRDGAVDAPAGESVETAMQDEDSALW
jgi:hypothetical protein